MMPRWFKALPLVLAVLALIVLTASCGSDGTAQVRMINAIPDSGQLDIYFNGANVFTGLPFGGVQPNTTPVSYSTVAAGSVTVQGFPAGDNKNPTSPNGVVTLNSGSQYTVIGVGLVLSESPPLVMIDTNTEPISGNVEFRVANASPGSPLDGVDVYIVPPGADITTYTPQIAALSYDQASGYQNVTFLESGYSVIVTETGHKTALFTLPYAPNAASITTLVLVDNPGGNNEMSQTPLILNDLN